MAEYRVGDILYKGEFRDSVKLTDIAFVARARNGNEYRLKKVRTGENVSWQHVNSLNVGYTYTEMNINDVFLLDGYITRLVAEKGTGVIYQSFDADFNIVKSGLVFTVKAQISDAKGQLEHFKNRVELIEDEWVGI